MISGLHRHDPRSPAVIAAGEGTVFNYEQLASAIETNRSILASVPRPALCLLSCQNSVGSIVAYLACLAARMPVCLVEPKPDVLPGLIERYRPSCLILPAGASPVDGYRDSQILADGQYNLFVHPDRTPYTPGLHKSLALLLATSGSTGNTKLVRLSRKNLVANAQSISTYLQLGPGERSVQSLPMHYAYGLSLINSHLYSGGTVVLNPHSFMQLEFWQVFDQTECTSFAGVPYMYQLLRRLNFNPATRSTLRTMTQAGGGMKPELISYYHRTALRSKKRFYVMYGQTEATARISYVPPQQLGDKIGAVGMPIPGGTLRLEPVDEFPGAEQLVYAGPNVMLGYANGPGDLALGDVQRGILRTADLGRVDADGYFYVLGRLKRIAKVFGKRINLADVETEAERRFPCRAAALERDDKIRLFVEPLAPLDPRDVRLHLARFLSVRPHVVRVEFIDQIPMTSSGKKDYQALGSPQSVGPATK